MKRLIATVLTVAALLFATPAFAEDDYTQGDEGEYVLALWQAPAPTPNHWPQVLVTTLETNDTSLNALDSFMQCETTYQVDLYANDATTAALVAGGYLNGPGNPRESWPGGSYRNSFSKVVTTDPCPIIVDPPVIDEPPAAPPATPAPQTPKFTG